MPKYKQSNTAGEIWRRSPQIYCYNKYGEIPAICYDEEDIIALNSGEFATNHLNERLIQRLLPELANTTFQLRDPNTEEYIDKYATYSDVFVLLHSLYFHLAEERDKGETMPYPSWIWNEVTHQWEAPVQKPEGNYVWDESQQQWVESLG